MSTLRANTLSDASGSNSVPMATVASGTAKAWVNFNGTGTVAILAAFNVTSITDNGTGSYTVNFTTAMPDVNYSVTGSAMRSSDNYTAIFTAPVNTDAGGTRTTTAAKVGAVLLGVTVSNVDAGYMSVAIFR